MKAIIKLEELALFLLGIYVFSQLDYAWWWFPALFLLPDVGMLGYLLGTKAGAAVYNFFHHKAVAIFAFMAGIYLENGAWQLAGVILFSHASFDRMLGYGLKYAEGFKFTHLGKIGKETVYERRGA